MFMVYTEQLNKNLRIGAQVLAPEWFPWETTIINGQLLNTNMCNQESCERLWMGFLFLTDFSHISILVLLKY